MKSKFLLVQLSTLLLAVGCIPKQLSHTERKPASMSPWEEKTVKANSGQSYDYMFIKSQRVNAPSLVLLHGGFLDNRIWLYTHELAKNFDVYAPRWPDNSLFYSGHIEDLGYIAADFIEAVELKNIVLAGVSMGAYGAIEVAANHKKIDVKALILLSAVMLAVNDEEVDGRTSVAKKALGFSPYNLQRIVEWSFFRKEFVTPQGAVSQKDIFYTRPYPYYYQVFQLMLNQGAKPQSLDKIDCPVYLLHGTKDETMPIEIAQKSPGLFLDAKMETLDGLGHDMVFTHGEKIVSMMVSFLKSKNLL